MPDSKKPRKKRAYQKPKLIRVGLTADEVMVTGCKNLPSGSGPSGAGCGLSGTACFDSGS